MTNADPKGTAPADPRPPEGAAELDAANLQSLAAWLSHRANVSRLFMGDHEDAMNLYAAANAAQQLAALRAAPAAGHDDVLPPHPAVRRLARALTDALAALDAGHAAGGMCAGLGRVLVQLDATDARVLLARIADRARAAAGEPGGGR